MKKKLPTFVKLPTAWIGDGGLRTFTWKPNGSDHLAALMVLIVIAQHMDPDDGVARLTFTQLGDMASIGREKVSRALDILAARGLIERWSDGRSTYQVVGYDPSGGWAKLPVKGLYHNGVVSAFQEFRLRRRAELDAVKLYLLFAARRSNDTNMAKIGYDKIEDYTGIGRPFIRSALSVLGAHGLVQIERFDSVVSESGVANAYRLSHLDSYRHMGTIGREDPAAAFAALEEY